MTSKMANFSNQNYSRRAIIGIRQRAKYAMLVDAAWIRYQLQDESRMAFVPSVCTGWHEIG